MNDYDSTSYARRFTPGKSGWIMGAGLTCAAVLAGSGVAAAAQDAAQMLNWGFDQKQAASP